MCDYSLEHLASRPAKVHDKLVTTSFRYSLTTVTGGFCAIGEPNIAVCLTPGTELAFDREIAIPGGFFRSKKLGTKVARFRQVNAGCRAMHHDALELPDGQIILVTRLCEGQMATVIQLPAGNSQEEVSGATVVEAAATRPAGQLTDARRLHVR
jgi:hypothetical protein